MNKINFASKLLKWYKSNQRELPWRLTKDPYYIWLSEIILQQTRVKQGLPYYLDFIKNYPTIQDLAAADQQEVLRLWQGLGYYSRARNMHSTAQYISQELQGKFPQSYKELLKLKGVGKYTAAAIASFAFNEKVSVVDGNVYRVLARIFGIETAINSTEGMKEFAALAQSLLPDESTDTYNQAIMEFGALHCSPAKPNCMYCPFQEICVAYQEGKQGELPRKKGKIKTRERFFHYFIFIYEDQLALKKREEKDVWQGLYDFFLLEMDQFYALEDLLAHQNLSLPSDNFRIEQESEIFKHILTHQKIWAKFWHIRLKNIELVLNEFNKVQFYPPEEVQNLPKPILINNYLYRNFF